MSKFLVNRPSPAQPRQHPGLTLDQDADRRGLLARFQGGHIGITQISAKAVDGYHLANYPVCEQAPNRDLSRKQLQQADTTARSSG